VPSLNLQPSIRGARAKKIMSSSYRKFAGATQKKKIEQTTKSKTSRLASNAFLVFYFKNDGRKGFAGIQLHLSLHQFRTLTEPFLSLTIRRKERDKTLIVRSLLVVSLKTTMEKSG